MITKKSASDQSVFFCACPSPVLAAFVVAIGKFCAEANPVRERKWRRALESVRDRLALTLVTPKLESHRTVMLATLIANMLLRYATERTSTIMQAIVGGGISSPDGMLMVRHPRKAATEAIQLLADLDDPISNTSTVERAAKMAVHLSTTVDSVAVETAAALDLLLQPESLTEPPLAPAMVNVSPVKKPRISFYMSWDKPEREYVHNPPPRRRHR